MASAIRAHLATDEDARAVVMVPLRDDTTLRLRAAFRAILEGGEGGEGRLTCYEEQELEGQDDWEASSVRCWLGIFGRA